MDTPTQLLVFITHFFCQFFGIGEACFERLKPHPLLSLFYLSRYFYAAFYKRAPPAKLCLVGSAYLYIEGG
jgi:hypothetical protein